MDKEKMIASTITWARSPNEERAIIDSITELSTRDFKAIVVVYGGSSKQFLDELSAIPKTTIITNADNKGLQYQVVESLRRASKENAGWVFYTESNKFHFFKDKLDEFLSTANSYMSQDKNCGIILPLRSKRSFMTFPPFQREAETVINNAIQVVTNQALDCTYGPRIISSDLLECLDELPEGIDWGWMSYVLTVAHKKGKSIYGVELDLDCPKDDRAEGTKEKLLRIKQLGDHIRAIHYASKLTL